MNTNTNNDNVLTLSENSKKTTATRQRLFTESVGTTEEPAAYAESTLSLHEYRLLNPQTSGTPTLTQSGVLGAMLNRILIKKRRAAERMARRERRRAAMKQAIMHPIKAMAALLHLQPAPVAASQRVGVRMTSTYLALPRP